jgi:hypothetical protein
MQTLIAGCTAVPMHAVLVEIYLTVSTFVSFPALPAEARLHVVAGFCSIPSTFRFAC